MLSFTADKQSIRRSIYQSFNPSIHQSFQVDEPGKPFSSTKISSFKFKEWDSKKKKKNG